MLFQLPTLVLVAALLQTSCYGETKDDKSMETNFIVPYDVSFNLSCHNYAHKFDYPIPSDSYQMMWILPNGDFISHDSHDQSSENHKRVQVFNQGRQLKIHKVNDEDFGTYTCLIHTLMTNQFTVIQKTININGPYWGDLTEKYRINLIIGSVAASVVFLLMLSFCWCYHRNPYDSCEDDRVLSAFNSTVQESHDNFTYDPEVKNTLPDSSPAMEVQEVKVQVQHAVDTKL